MTTGPPTETLPARAGLSGGLLTALFVAVAGVGVLIAVMRGSSPTAAVGQPAPAIAVTLFDGEVFDLVEHFQQRRGPVLLNLWASWCPPCRAEIPDISAYAEANPGTAVVGLAVEDSEHGARDFAAEIGASYPLALGTPGVEDAYPNLGLPATYIIDENGVVKQIINGIVDEDTLTTAVG